MGWSDDTRREVARLFGEAQAKAGRRRMVMEPKTTRPPATRLAKISAALGRIALAVEDLEPDEQEDALSTALALLGEHDRASEKVPAPDPSRARGTKANPGLRSATPAQDALVASLESEGPQTAAALSSTTGRSITATHHALAKLMQAGRVERVPEGMGLFRLVP
jgi:hypothetical protein